MSIKANLDLMSAHSRNTKAIDEANAREIDGILTYLSLCERTTNDLPSAREFDGAYLYGQQGGIQQWDPETTLERAAAQIARWSGRFVSVAHQDDIAYDLSRITELDDFATRMLLTKEPQPWLYHGARALQFEFYGITEQGYLRNDGCVHTFRKAGHLLVPSRLSKQDAEAAAVVGANLVICLYEMERRWSVKVRFGDGMPSVGFFTDPTGILQFLKFRDKADGKNRRDAVIHWVAQHWRQNRHDPDVEIYVRKHLRGKSTHEWHGMGIRVVIPEADHTEVAVAVAERKRLSAANLAKRVKEHRKQA